MPEFLSYLFPLQKMFSGGVQYKAPIERYLKFACSRVCVTQRQAQTFALIPFKTKQHCQHCS